MKVREVGARVLSFGRKRLMGMGLRLGQGMPGDAPDGRGCPRWPLLAATRVAEETVCAVASVKLRIASGCLAARMAMAFECYDMNPNPTPTNNFDPHTEALTSAAGAVAKCVGCVVTKCF